MASHYIIYFDWINCRKQFWPNSIHSFITEVLLHWEMPFIVHAWKLWRRNFKCQYDTEKGSNSLSWIYLYILVCWNFTFYCRKEELSDLALLDHDSKEIVQAKNIYTVYNKILWSVSHIHVFLNLCYFLFFFSGTLNNIWRMFWLL